MNASVCSVSRVSSFSMLRSVHAVIPNMEEIARLTEIPSERLWAIWSKPDHHFRHRNFESALTKLFISLFPAPQFSDFVERIDAEAQAAFEKAIATTKDGIRSGDRSPLSALFETHWPYLRTSMSGFHDPNGLAYLRTRFPLLAGWANVPLPHEDQHPRTRTATYLVMAQENVKPLIDALDRDCDEHSGSNATDSIRGFKVRALKAKIAAVQRLALYANNQHTPLIEILDLNEIRRQVDYLLATIEAWPEMHPFRCNWARDAVTWASALADPKTSVLLCRRGYKILVKEDPRFLDPDYEMWSEGPASEDPDLSFFRAHIDEIRPDPLT